MKFGYLFTARDKECLQQTMTHDKNKQQKMKRKKSILLNVM